MEQCTRRRFAGVGVTVLVAGLAGCLDDDPEDPAAPEDTDDEPVDDVDDDVDDEEVADDDDLDDEDVDDDDNVEEEEDVPQLIIHLENEDGEPVSHNVIVRIESEERAETFEFSEDIEDGTVQPTMEMEGAYTITVESTADEFEPVEEEVVIEDDPVEITIQLDGATPDGEVNEEDDEEELEDG